MILVLFVSFVHSSKLLVQQDMIKSNNIEIRMDPKTWMPAVLKLNRKQQKVISKWTYDLCDKPKETIDRSKLHTIHQWKNDDFYSAILKKGDPMRVQVYYKGGIFSLIDIPIGM